MSYRTGSRNSNALSPPTTKMIGTTLSHYKITEKIGQGGMGEVYRATDTKLKRNVALKILPESFAQDPHRMGRFQREAEVLASLNHPNIAGVYGLEHDADSHAIAMELVEGKTLAARISKGAIPPEEALQIALQIAEALEAAHEKRIIHRDLKPANVMVTPNGKVKVLDFGLAKAFDRGGTDLSQSNSPTLSIAATQQGFILGTAAYMSPEQARGQEVDTRTDIWAFGCVLYEILTGRRAFGGETVSDTLAAILRADPDLAALPEDTPRAVRRLLTRCLHKDPRLRLHHVGDARLEVLDGLAGLDAEVDLPLTAMPQRRFVPALLVTGVVAAVLSGLAVWSSIGTRESAAPQLSRWLFEPPNGGRFRALNGEGPWLPYPPIAVSADGELLAYAAAVTDGPVHLWLRNVDGLDVRQVPGTEGAELPFFSPDGAWLGFWADGALQKVRVEGGRPEKIADIPSRPRGAAWAADDTVVFGGDNTGLQRVAAGGIPVEITEPDAERLEQYHGWPSLLPGGGIAFTVVTGEGGELAVLSPDRVVRVLRGTEGSAQPHYLDTGHLVFFRSGGLVAASFDPASGELTAAITPVVDDVLTGWAAGLDLGVFALSATGNLFHFAGESGFEQNRIVLVDRQGNTGPLPGDRPGKYSYLPAVSPDGKRLAVSNRSDRPSGDVWLRDLETGSEGRLTRAESVVSIRPCWTTDGLQLFFSAYSVDAPDPFDIYRMLPDGSGVELVLSRPYSQQPDGVSQDYLVFGERHPSTGKDLYLWPLEGDGDAIGFATTWANEFHGSFSPDGRYLAYVSDETGQNEVYVKPVEGPGNGVLVSPGGGISPRWSPAGDELFYLRGSTMMAAPVALEPTFQRSTPKELFTGGFDSQFDVVPAGPHFVAGDTRFVMLTLDSRDLSQLIVSLNWAAELQRQIPSER